MKKTAKKKLGRPANDPGVPFDGEALRVLRTAYGLTQCDVANDLETSDSHVSDWEKGRRSPTATNLRDLASYFDAPLRAFESIHQVALHIVAQGADAWGKGARS